MVFITLPKILHFVTYSILHLNGYGSTLVAIVLLPIYEYYICYIFIFY